MAKLLSVCLVLVLVTIPVYAQEEPKSPTGNADFKTKGFPTLAFITGVCFVFWGLSSGYSAGGGDTSSGQTRVFLAINAINTFTAIFFVFAPGSAPHGTVLSLFLFYLVALGYYAALTNSPAANMAWWLMAVFVQLAMLGCLNFMNFATVWYEFAEMSCAQYFSKNLDRCKDDGFLQLLRVFGAFTVMLLPIAIAQLFPKLTWSAAFSKAGAGAQRQDAPAEAREGLVANSFQSSGPLV